jgi:hypothetical protein
VSRKLTRELQVVNRAREKLGLPTLAEFPKAIPNRATACLLARSLGRAMKVSAGRQFVACRDEKEQKALRSLWRTGAISVLFVAYGLYLPPLLNKLANEFDAGKFPELVA